MYQSTSPGVILLKIFIFSISVEYPVEFREINNRLSPLTTSNHIADFVSDRDIDYGLNASKSFIWPSLLHRKEISSEGKSKKRKSRWKQSDNYYLPQKVDWRNKGVLTSIKDQKNCGACWAFSIVETVEAMYAIKTGTLLDLSSQQLIDCSPNGNKCNGGDTCLTLKWLTQARVKILLEEKYPTTLKNEECRAKDPPKGVMIDTYECHDYSSNEDEILNIVANHGPVAVAVNSKAWHDYLGGIIQYHCDNNVDHAVQIVGYDLTGEVPYYIVRNSWGSHFGHQGYLYVKIGANVCGIAQEVASLTIA